jgi:hypothetical protein
MGLGSGRDPVLTDPSRHRVNERRGRFRATRLRQSRSRASRWLSPPRLSATRSYVLQRAFTFEDMHRHAAVAWGILGGDIADTWRRFNGAYFNDALSLSHSSSARHCPSANASGNARTIQVTTEAAEPSRPDDLAFFGRPAKSISRSIDARLAIAACASSIGTLFPGLGPLRLTGSLAGWLLGLIAMRWP